LKAIYVLIIQVENLISLKIGSLGKVVFNKGSYAYVGSAQSNFYKRINRHKCQKKKIFWHIDYLLTNKTTRIIKIFFKVAKKTEECKLAQLISKKGKSLTNFGSSIYSI
jgi:Uri superfamily endonuclease